MTAVAGGAARAGFPVGQHMEPKASLHTALVMGFWSLPAASPHVTSPMAGAAEGGQRRAGSAPHGPSTAAGNCGRVQGHHSSVKQLLRGELQGPEVPSALYFIFFTCSPRCSTLKHVVLHSIGTTVKCLCLAVLRSLEADEREFGLLHHPWHSS